MSCKVQGKMSHLWSMRFNMLNIMYLLFGYIHVGSFLCKLFMNQNGKKAHFVDTNESCKKHVQHAFEMLQAHFQIIPNPYGK